MPPTRWALASLSLSMLMPSLDTSITTVALPTLARAFDASFQDVQWVVLAYLLAITALIVSAGRLGDIVGRKRLLLLGIALFTVTSLLSGLAPTLGLLIAARGAQGLGAAIMMALAVASVGETVPKARIGGAMGLLGTTSAIGTTLGPSLGGLLIAAHGWRPVFLLNVPLGLLGFMLVLQALPADCRVAKGGRGDFDAVGTLLLALTLMAYALAMTIGRGRFGVQNLALLSVAALGVVLFLIVQGRVASPLLRPDVFRHPTLRAGLTTSALVSTVMMATLVVGPFYLSGALGLGAARVGLAMSAGPLVAGVTGVLAGRIVDRFGAPRMATLGLTGMAGGLVVLVAAPPRFGVAAYVAAIVVVTASYALFQTANNTSVMTGIGSDQRGVASGMLGLSRNLGLITGASVMGAVFAFASETTEVAPAHPAAVAAGMRATFAVAALLTLAALAIATAGCSRTGRPAVAGTGS